MRAEYSSVMVHIDLRVRETALTCMHNVPVNLGIIGKKSRVV